MYTEYRYSPTDLDEELFLSEIPVEVLQNSIDTQFQYPLEYRKKDYIQSFIMKYNFSKDNLLDDDLAFLDLQYNRFISFIEKTFYDFLNVGFNNIDSLDEEDALELIHLTYRFFIKNIKKNFVNVILNYIQDSEEDITEKYENKKDITSLNFKLEIENNYDTLVLSNLGDIISDFLEELRNCDDIDRFFNLCQSDEHFLELEFVIDSYDKMELTGNFIEKYIDMLDDGFIVEIQSKVRNKILKKYSKREAKEIINELDKIEETEIDNVEMTEDE